MKQHALYKPVRELDQSRLIVTELEDPNIHYELKDDIKKSQITCLTFSCSIDDFNQLPSTVLSSCKRLMKEFTGVTQIELSSFSPHTFRRVDLAYVDLLIDSREPVSTSNDAKICLNVMKNIYKGIPDFGSRYMTNEVTGEIGSTIYAYIQRNGCSEFVKKFHQHFETEQSYANAVKVALGSTLVVTGSFMLAPPIGLFLLMWATLPVYLTSPGFTIGNGEIDFCDVSCRLKLTNLYKDIGGTIDYQLWADDPSYTHAMS